jgi:hypothetical protein
MLSNYIMLYLLALVAFIQSMPTNNSDYDEEKSDYHDNIQITRDLTDKVDGTIRRIKAAGITYRQRINDEQCLVEYDNQLLTESSVIQIRKKLYQVEDCLLERVFHACGPNLLLMLNVVCRVVEQHLTTTTTLASFKRETQSTLSKHNLRARANKTPRVITESCCEALCTISELTRYCHR